MDDGVLADEADGFSQEIRKVVLRDPEQDRGLGPRATLSESRLLKSVPCSQSSLSP